MTPPDDEPAPHHRVAPAAAGRFQDGGHGDGDRRADQDRAQRVDPGSARVARRCDGAGQRENHQPGDAQRPEDGVPVPEAKQQTRTEHAQDAAGTGRPGPDANGLGAVVFWIGHRQQRQRGGHDERGADPGHRPARDDLGRIVQQRGCHRADREHQQPGQQRTAPAVAVTDRAGRQQQARQCHGVSVDDPVQLRCGGRGGHRKVAERGVQRRHRRHHQGYGHAGDGERPVSCPEAAADADRVSTLVLVRPDEGFDHAVRLLGSVRSFETNSLVGRPIVSF